MRSPVVALGHLIDAIEATVMRHKQQMLAAPERDLERALVKVWAKQCRMFLRKLEPLREARRLREAISDWQDDWEDVADQTADELAAALTDPTQLALLLGGQALIADLGDDGLENYVWDLANPRAVAFMGEHGAALVAGLNDTTRERLNGVLTDGLDRGLSYSKLAAEIRTLFDGFDANRANLVAVTETATAYEAGSRAVISDLTAAGLDFEKSWLAEDSACDECASNEDDGWIGVDDSFSGGSDTPPQHPRCRCTTLYQRAGAGYADSNSENESLSP